MQNTEKKLEKTKKLEVMYCTVHRDKQQLEKYSTVDILHTTCAKRKLRMKEAYLIEATEGFGIKHRNISGKKESYGGE
jgi:hypothetical protein